MTEAVAGREPIIWAHPHLKRALAVLTVFAMVPASWWDYGRVTWLTPPGGEIAAVVRAAITKNEDLLQPPARYYNSHAPAAVVSRLRARALHELPRIYTGELLATWENMARSQFSRRDVHSWRRWDPRVTVDWVHLDTLTFFPGLVTASASVEDRSNGGAVNRMDYQFRLVHTSSGWRINSETSNYEPGYGP